MAGEAAAVIGKSVQIRGEVKGNEDLVVEGLVEGTITLSGNRLTVGPHARVKANVVGRDVIVQGSLQGDVQATGRVELRAGETLAVHLWYTHSESVVPDVDRIGNGSALVLLIMVLAFNVLARIVGRALTRRFTGRSS